MGPPSGQDRASRRRNAGQEPEYLMSGKRSLPRVAALAAASVGAINVASALTPTIPWRGHLSLSYEPLQAMRLFHAPRCQQAPRCCLLPSRRRRSPGRGRRAAGRRGAFGVRHEPVTLRSAIWRVRCCWRPGRRLQCWQLGHRSPTRFK